MSDLLEALRKNREFTAVLDEALKRRPVIPAFSICETKDQQEMVVEHIKYHTAMRNGFDLLWQHLSGRAPKGD